MPGDHLEYVASLSAGGRGRSRGSSEHTRAIGLGGRKYPRRADIRGEKSCEWGHSESGRAHPGGGRGGGGAEEEDAEGYVIVGSDQQDPGRTDPDPDTTTETEAEREAETEKEGGAAGPSPKRTPSKRGKSLYAEDWKNRQESPWEALRSMIASKDFVERLKNFEPGAP